MATLKALLETSLADYLTAASVGTTNIYKGHSNLDKDAPCVICQVASLEEEPLHSGNYNAECHIIVKSMGADGEYLLDSIDEAVRNAIWTDTLAADLQVAGLTIWGAAASHKTDFGVEDDALTATHIIILHCAPMTFPA